MQKTGFSKKDILTKDSNMLDNCMNKNMIYWHDICNYNSVLFYEGRRIGQKYIHFVSA